MSYSPAASSSPIAHRSGCSPRTMSEPPSPITDFRPDLPASLAVSDHVVPREGREGPATECGRHRAHARNNYERGRDPSMPPLLLDGPGMFKKALAIYAVAFVAVAILAKGAIVGIGLPTGCFRVH
jgi:hypothetical protein